MPHDEGGSGHWKEVWEAQATETHAAYRSWPPAELLRAADDGRYDPYHTLWSAIRERCILADAAPVLLRVLRRESDEPMMLVRYHCAGALFGLLGFADDPLPELRQRVMWPRGDEAARLRACDELEAMVRRRLGTATDVAGNR